MSLHFTMGATYESSLDNGATWHSVDTTAGFESWANSLGIVGIWNVLLRKTMEGESKTWLVQVRTELRSSTSFYRRYERGVCAHCGNGFVGTTKGAGAKGKRFCDHVCRSSFNNKKRK